MIWWVLTGSNRRHSPCKGDALPTELSTLLHQQRPLVYSIFERFTSSELRRICSFNLNGGARARITAITGSAFTDIERAKTNQGYRIPLFHCFCYSSRGCI